MSHVYRHLVEMCVPRFAKVCPRVRRITSRFQKHSVNDRALALNSLYSPSKKSSNQIASITHHLHSYHLLVVP